MWRRIAVHEFKISENVQELTTLVEYKWISILYQSRFKEKIFKENFIKCWKIINIISKIYNSQRLNISLEFISKCYSLSDNMDIRYHGRYYGNSPST